MMSTQPAGSASDAWTTATPGLLLGRVRGVPVLLAPSWWLGALLVTALYAPLVDRLVLAAGAVTTLLLAVTLPLLLVGAGAVHELAHGLAAARLGIPVLRVRLFLLGGICELARQPTRPRDEAAMAAVAPGASLLLGLLGAAGWWVLWPDGPGLGTRPTIVALLLAECAVAGAAVAAFNLLPGLPLDGGRLVRALVWAGTGRRAAGTSAAIGGAVALALGLVLYGMSRVVVGADGAWLQLALCAVLAWSVVSGSGAAGPQRSASWPPGLSPLDVLRPVLQLPAESPLDQVLLAAAGRGVVLVRPDGTAVGLLDPGLAEWITGTAPGSPAERAVTPIRPESVVRSDETGDQVLERVRAGAADPLLMIGPDSRPLGVLYRRDVTEVTVDAE